MSEDKECKSFIFIDLETTGLDRLVEITELSMVAVNRRHMIQCFESPETLPRVLDKFTVCVRPVQDIEQEAASMTGLSAKRLKKKGRFDTELGQSVLNFIHRKRQPSCLVAHNGDNYDFGILASELELVGIVIPDNVKFADSWKAFRQLHYSPSESTSSTRDRASEIEMGGTGRPSFSLANLYKRYVGCPVENAHSAEADAIALLRLVLHKPEVLPFLDMGRGTFTNKGFRDQAHQPWLELEEARRGENLRGLLFPARIEGVFFYQ